MRKKLHNLFICLVLISGYVSAQQILTLEEAVALAIKNNYAVQISNNETEISKNNVSRGNAGMLPQLSLNAAPSYSGNDTKQEFADGRIIDKTGASSNTISAGLAFSWIVFDGFRMFVSYDKLKELNRMSSIASRIQIENTMVDVISSYYAVVSQKQLLKVNENLLAIYEERLRVAKTKWDVGKAAKTDYLQAQLDLNIQKTSRIKLLAGMTGLKTKLNQTINRKADIDFDVIDEISVDKNLNLDELNQSAMKMNSSLLLNQSNISVYEFSIREFEAGRYPTITLNSGYNFTRTSNQASFITYNRNLGWNVGLSANWLLFNGHNTSRNIANAKISLKNAQLELDNAKLEVESSMYKSYKNYKAALEALSLEEESAKLAKENMDIQFESFKLGKANTLEFKDAQKSYEDALNSLLQSRYDAKLAETDLLKLKGDLVK